MPDSATSNEGLVVAAHGQRGTLETEGQRQIAYLVRGKRQRVVCGDRVKWASTGTDDIAIIEEINNRNNILQRREPGRQGAEILAANLTCLVAVAAPSPKPDWFVIDRYLSMGALMNCKLILVANKTDLLKSETRESFDAEISDYLAAGYDCLSVSANTGDGVDVLAEHLQDEIAILVGQSGVGKSSIINRLIPGTDIATREVSRATREGRHTTTASAMHRLPNGGRLIDSPGVRDFVPMIDAITDVAAGFPEITALADECRFSNCRHLREPNCAVKNACDSNRISARRYESYKRLLKSVPD